MEALSLSIRKIWGAVFRQSELTLPPRLIDKGPASVSVNV